MSTRVVLFKADDYPGVMKHTVKLCDGYTVMDTSADDGAYWRALRECWDEDHGRALLAVHQDVLIAAGTVEALEACPRDWCTLGPGVTWYSGGLRRRVPSGAVLHRLRLDGAPWGHWAARGELRWDTVGGYLRAALEDRGYRLCRHERPAPRRAAEGIRLTPWG